MRLVPIWLVLPSLLTCGPYVRSQDAPGEAAPEIPDAAVFCVGRRAETTASGDFSLQDGGRVIRHEATGLEWTRCALSQTWTGRVCEGEPKTYDWRRAGRAVDALGQGWRLPTLEELNGIVERCRPAPAINQQVFPNTRGSYYWSSTDDLAGLDRAWSVSFFSGSSYSASKRQGLRVRPVRAVADAAPDQPAPAAAGEGTPATGDQAAPAAGGIAVPAAPDQPAAAGEGPPATGDQAAGGIAAPAAPDQPAAAGQAAPPPPGEAVAAPGTEVVAPAAPVAEVAAPLAPAGEAVPAAPGPAANPGN